MNNMIEGLKAGKQEAWNMMIDSYSKKVYNLALNFAGNPDDASDITQDIFLKVYNNIDKFHDDSNFTSWLLRLAKNYCIDFWRKNKHNRKKMDLEDNLYHLQAGGDDSAAPNTPEESVIRRSDVKFLREKLQLLPPDLRTLIIMRDIQDYSYQEIAEHLDIPLGTTKSRINRARTKLAKIVLKEGKSNG